MTALETNGKVLSELGRARAEAVLRGGCLEALRVALANAGYPVALVRDALHFPDRLWIEPREIRDRQASIAVGCGRFDDGWWFYRPWGRQLARVDDLDEAVRVIGRQFASGHTDPPADR